MEINIGAALENYKERVERIGLFDCLYKLDQKKKKDRQGRAIDYYSLGLLALLFFFENMLMRNKKTGVKELALFYQKLNQGEIDIDEAEFESLARSVIDVFRPTGGKRPSKTFYNWESRQMETIEYTYLSASKSDMQSNTQYYTLAEHGLELVFATKEYYSEFQLSINQLLLRKQLEKGEFAGALRQIDEMRIEVEALENRITQIKYEVQRNILSEVTYKRYQELIEDISLRLNRENEEFDELIAFVNQTRETLAYDIQTEKEMKAYNYIIAIQKELGAVHQNHRKLLQKSIELKTSTLQSAQEALYYMGVESFNFKKEIVSRLFASPLPVETAGMLLKPFLYLEKRESWSPMTLFAPQRLFKREKEPQSNQFLEKKSEEEMEANKIQIQNDFGKIAHLLKLVLEDKEEITLEQMIQWMKGSPYEKWLENSIFYHFFVILHQKSPLKINGKNIDTDGVLKLVFEQLRPNYKRLIVIELKEQLHINQRYTMSNLKIKLERVKDDV